MRLRLLSLNTWGLPFGLARDLPLRTEALAATFATCGADVIALQEVWTPRARNRLLDVARDAGFEHAFFVDHDMGNAGLLLLSRHAFVRGVANEFRVRGRAERVQHGDFWGAKGWLDVVLDTPAGPLRVVNTHLHAAYADPHVDAHGDPRDNPQDNPGDDYAGERMAQVVELAHGLGPGSTAVDRALPTVAVGDFNLHESSEAYDVWRSLASVDDVAALLDARAMTVQAGHPYVDDATPDQRIDFAFARDGGHLQLHPTSIVPAYDEAVVLGNAGQGRYSDHVGLQVELQLEPGPRRPCAAGMPIDRATSLARDRLETAAADAEDRAQSQTLIGAAGLLASGAAGLAGDLGTRNRRAVLRGLALGIPALGFVASGLSVGLGQSFTHAAAQRFHDTARLLRAFEPR